MCHIPSSYSPAALYWSPQWVQRNKFNIDFVSHVTAPKACVSLWNKFLQWRMCEEREAAWKTIYSTAPIKMQHPTGSPNGSASLSISIGMLWNSVVHVRVMRFLNWLEETKAKQHPDKNDSFTAAGAGEAMKWKIGIVKKVLVMLPPSTPNKPPPTPMYPHVEMSVHCSFWSDWWTMYKWRPFSHTPFSETRSVNIRLIAIIAFCFQMSETKNGVYLLWH